MRDLIGSQLVGVVLTHTHWDHVAGVPAVVQQDLERPGRDSCRLSVDWMQAHA